MTLQQRLPAWERQQRRQMGLCVERRLRDSDGGRSIKRQVRIQEARRLRLHQVERGENEAGGDR